METIGLVGSWISGQPTQYMDGRGFVFLCGEKKSSCGRTLTARVWRFAPSPGKRPLVPQANAGLEPKRPLEGQGGAHAACNEGLRHRRGNLMNGLPAGAVTRHHIARLDLLKGSDGRWNDRLK